jgi:hypothetical protein
VSGGGAGVVVVAVWWYSLCSVVFVQGCNGTGSESICFDLVFEKKLICDGNGNAG